MDKPKKEDFSTDPRMSFNQQTGKWSYVGEDDVSYEYDDTVGAWFPMVNQFTFFVFVLFFVPF
jgi:HIV Tat-specific factor 1